ncbi:hypothetical protein ACQZV8_09190 [Magnetococcales bacterium HHB-1]
MIHIKAKRRMSMFVVGGVLGGSMLSVSTVAMADPAGIGIALGGTALLGLLLHASQPMPQPVEPQIDIIRYERKRGPALRSQVIHSAPAVVYSSVSPIQVMPQPAPMPQYHARPVATYAPAPRSYAPQPVSYAAPRSYVPQAQPYAPMAMPQQAAPQAMPQAVPQAMPQAMPQVVQQPASYAQPQPLYSAQPASYSPAPQFATQPSYQPTQINPYSVIR